MKTNWFAVDHFRSVTKMITPGMGATTKLIKRAGISRLQILADPGHHPANDKVQDVIIKKLTRKNPTMAARFEELKEEVEGKTEKE